MDDMRKIGEPINAEGGERLDRIAKEALGHIHVASGRRRKEMRAVPTETVGEERYPS